MNMQKLAVLTLLAAAACGAPPDATLRGDRVVDAPASATDCIVVAGRRVSIGTRVVTWDEPGGYSAYRLGKHFDRSEELDGEQRLLRFERPDVARTEHGVGTVDDDDELPAMDALDD